MTKERALEILSEIGKTRFGWQSKKETIDEIIGMQDHQEIMEKWRTMPGWTCYADALNRIARGETE